MNEVWILEETDVILGDNFDEFIKGKVCFSSREKAIKFMDKFCFKLLHDNESDLKDCKVWINRTSHYDNESGAIDQWSISFYYPKDNEEYSTCVRLENFEIM